MAGHPAHVNVGRIECPERAQRVEGPVMAPPTYFVYIVRCADGSYYSGVTTDLQTRVSTHNSGQGAAWTAARRPVVLVYHEPALDERRALARERQIKG